MALTIDELNIQITSDSKNATRALNSLIKKLEKLKTTLDGSGVSSITISNSFNKITNSVENLGKSTEKASKGVTKVVENFANGQKPLQGFTDKLARNISKWRTLYSVFQNAANTMSEWFTSSNDYVETLNLFNVTMGEGADAAKKFADSVSEAMGIDVAEWMSYQGTFKQLTSGFGIVEDKANTMSQNLTQLSYDLASFFNTDVETAFDKLSSAMAGQVKGLREFGIDTTVASLQEYALAQGIEKSVRSMTQAEKSMLRYNYIMENSIKIQGDMARTIATPANSIRILTALLAQMKRALGNIVSVIVVKFIPYVQVMVEIVTDAANALANFLGYELPKIDYSGLGSGFADEFEDAEESIGGVSDGIKAIKKQLMGFDELNIISNPDTSSSDAGGGNGAGGPLDMKPIEYNFLEGLKTDKLDEIKEKLKKAAGWAAAIGTAILGWKLGSFITDLATAGMEAKGFVESLKLLGKKFTLTAGITLAVTGLVIQWSEVIESIKEGLDGESFGKLLAGGGLQIAGGAMIGSFFGGGLLGAAIGAIAAAVPMLITGVYDAIVNGFDWMNGVLIPLASTLGGAGIGAIVGIAVASLTGPVGAAIGAVIGLVVGALTDLGIWLWQNFESVEEWFNGLSKVAQGGIAAAVVAFGSMLGGLPLLITAVITIIKKWDDIVAAVKTAATTVGEFFVNLWDGIVSVWNAAPEWFNTQVITPIVNFFSNVWTSISTFFVNLWNDIVSIWTAVSEWFNTNVVQPTVVFFTSLWDGIKQLASDCWEGIKGFFTPAVEWFTELFNSISQTISDIFYNIGVIASGCWEIIKAAWGIATAWFDENVIAPVTEFFSQLWADVSGFFVNLWEDIKEVWNTVAEWFDNEVIQPVVNFFTELWATIKETAVNAWETIKEKAIGAWEGIKSTFSTIKTWINTNIIQPVGKFFVNLWEGFKDGAKKAWEGIKGVFSKVGDFFSEVFTKAWQKIVNVFSVAGEIFVKIKDGIVSAFKFIVNGLIKGINSVVTVPFNKINETLMWLKDLNILGITPFANLREISVPQIPLLAEGGIVGEGQMFIAREAGPELVGQIGNKTAVANNDQIVDGIANGVYRAMMAANGNGSKPININATFTMDGEVIGKKVIKYHNGVVMQTGESPLLV